MYPCKNVEENNCRTATNHMQNTYNTPAKQPFKNGHIYEYTYGHMTPMEYMQTHKMYEHILHMCGLI